LRQRLTELADNRIVQYTSDGRYELTPLGRELGDAIWPLNQWAQRWASSLPQQ